MATPLFLRGRGGRGRGQPLETHAEVAALAAAPSAPNPQALQRTASAQSTASTTLLSAAPSSSSVPNLSSSEDEDEEVHNEAILTRTFASYYQGGGDGGKAASDSAAERTEGMLSDAMRKGATVCLICLDSIKHSHQIWTCRGCYVTLHLGCIQGWIRSNDAQQAAASLAAGPTLHTVAAGTLSSELFPAKERFWCCPKCRKEYSQQKQFPSRYECYCGKTRDPVFDPWITPHSCGERCDRPLQPGCGHTCVLLCHPGPCPPCPLTISSTCHCGKVTRQRRCGDKAFSCGSPCGALLSCGTHKCAAFCHTGPCAPCAKESMQKCVCGNESRLRPCASPPYQCMRACTTLLSCGHHTCSKGCHAGPCGMCELSGVRKCPCGKTTRSDIPCTQATVPTCLNTCGKVMACGVHRCELKCHQGECGQCTHTVSKTCPCGAKTKDMACAKEFTCDTKCMKMRDCGKHPCKRRCCPGNCPPCDERCGKKLQCGVHRCEAPCHVGACYPCPLTVTLSCACSNTRITLPCGSDAHVRTPRCNLPCQIPPYCRHERQAPHKCHEGECPACTQQCVQVLACGHTCTERCHDMRPQASAGPLTKTAKRRKESQKDKQEPEPPLPKLPTPCPPCKTGVEMQCYGGHDVVVRPCVSERVFACARTCGRPLTCQRHECLSPCHPPRDRAIKWADVDRAGASGALVDRTCGTCELNCSQARPAGCAHQCPSLCHPGPCAPCTVLVKVRCFCEALTLHHPCSTVTAASTPEQRAALQSCGNECSHRISCGHKCTKVCHTGSCSDPALCTRKVTARCACQRLKKEYVCKELQALQAEGFCGLPCDAECRAIKAAKEAEAEAARVKAIKDEEERNAREVAEFEASKLKRRKKKKEKEEVEEKPGMAIPQAAIIAGAVVALLAILWFALA